MRSPQRGSTDTAGRYSLQPRVLLLQYLYLAQPRSLRCAFFLGSSFSGFVEAQVLHAMAAKEGSSYDIKAMPVPMRENGSIAPMSNPMYKGIPPYTGAWGDCAYDPETPGPLYHPGMWWQPWRNEDKTRYPCGYLAWRGRGLAAQRPLYLCSPPSHTVPPIPCLLADQIRVPTEIDEVIRLYTKAAVREQPEDLIEWSRQWFEARAAETAAQKQLSSDAAPL